MPIDSALHSICLEQNAFESMCTKTPPKATDNPMSPFYLLYAHDSAFTEANVENVPPVR